ncbi:MAG: NADPH:quinone oxidoreductase family protein [Burkholderiaceae bacterium]
MAKAFGTDPIALVCDALTDDLAGVSVRAVARREPAEHEALIEVRAAALNFPDLLMTRGGYQHRPEVPFVLGMEGAGRILALGSPASARFRVGDRVVFHGKTGACATQACVSTDALAPAPAAFDDAQAAAYHVGATTAWAALVERGRLGAGESLLVHGASGGMGMAAVQLGIRLGARVLATARSRVAHARLSALGVESVIVPEPGWHEQVKSLTQGRGVDLIFDPVGGETFDGSLHAAAWGGRILIVGFTAGTAAQMPTNRALIKNLTILGVRAGEMGRRDASLGQRMDRAVRALARHADMAPIIGGRYTLADGLQALRALRDRTHPGKIVIEPRTTEETDHE